MNIHHAILKLSSVSYSEHSKMLGNNVMLQRSNFSDDPVMPTLLKIISLGHYLHNTRVLCLAKFLDIYYFDRLETTRGQAWSLPLLLYLSKKIFNYCP